MVAESELIRYCGSFVRFNPYSSVLLRSHWISFQSLVNHSVENALLSFLKSFWVMIFYIDLILSTVR